VLLGQFKRQSSSSRQAPLLAARTDDELDVPVEQPHPVFKTKLEAIEYNPPHELVHAGQIALLRRMMGKPPLR
jgi:hypothetical protein